MGAGLDHGSESARLKEGFRVDWGCFAADEVS